MQIHAARQVRPVDFGGKKMWATITIFRADDWVGKSFTLGPDGELRRDSRATIAKAEARVVPVETAAELVELIGGLLPCEAIGTGRIADGRERAVVVTSGKERRGRGEIARTLDFFDFPAGPGWLLLDHDAKAMPPDVARRVADLGGPVAALEHLWPELRTARRVVKASSSGGVYVDGGAPSIATGFHVFVALSDVSRSKSALSALQARAWAAGLAWVAFGKNGARLERSIVDVAVGSPERLIFTAPPRLGPGVKREPPPIEWQEGDVLDPPAAPAEDLFARHRDTALAEAEPEAIDRTAKARGIDRDAAAQIAREGREGGDLPPDLSIWRRDGSRVTVAELVAELRPGIARQALPDPFEGPTYGTTTATLFWNKDHAAPIIVSHAHGLRTIYRLPAPAQTPAKAVWTITPPRLPSRRDSDLCEALAACGGIDDAGTVLAVAQALARGVPHMRDMEGVRAFLTANLAPGALSDDWIDAILDRVGRAVEHRQRRALDAVRVSLAGRFAEGVEHHHVDALAPLDEITGITVIRAPMAAGKTQKVGAPFVAEARRRGGEIMAIAHRQSLIGELAQRLGLTDYRTPNALAEAWRTGGAAICLPSITLAEWSFEEPRFVFVDEVAQVLRFLTARDFCRTRDATAAGVFARLVEIIRNAEGVLCADAGVDDTVIDFLRFCRPGETIRVIEMRDPADAGIAATVWAGSDARRARAVDACAEELAAGGNVWVAVEGANLARDVGAYLAGFCGGSDAVLVLTAETKMDAREAAFFADPEAVSRRYRAIVASPVVSSGLSIEHRTGAHFTLGAFLGSGLAIEPADAAQMLRRVRYLRRFVIGLSVNNKLGGETAEAILDGRVAAAATEGAPVFAGSFDRLVAGFQARSVNLRADFAAGLWWQLRAAGWALERADAGVGGFGGAKAEIAAQRRAQRRDELIRACSWLPYTTEAEIDDLRRTATTTEQRRIVEAFDLTRALGVAQLTAADVDFLDDGGAGKMDLFEDLVDRDVDLPLGSRDQGAALVHRRLRRARRLHLAEIFEGFDPFDPDAVLTPETADRIVERIEAKADAYAASGAVPPRWRARYGERRAPRPADAVKAVGELLRRAGLKMVGTMVRCHTSPLPRFNEDGTKCDKRVRVYTVDPEAIAAMQTRLDARRNAALVLDTTPEAEHIAQYTCAKRLASIAKIAPIYGRGVEIEVETPFPVDVAALVSVAGAIRRPEFLSGGMT